MQLYSWNINGVRAALKKGFLNWLDQTQPDVLCLQESKAKASQLGFELTQIPGYQAHFAEAKRGGYSGVITYSKLPVNQTEIGLGIDKFDQEGRTIISHYPDFTLFNIYFPNGKASQQRLDYKMDYYKTLLEYLKKLLKDQPNIVICGDVNTAHQEVDLARPKDNAKISGFLPQERAWIDQLLEAGFIDSYRHLHPKQTDAYSWWSLRSGARQRNVGWRIDYFFISQNLKKNLKAAEIHSEVMGSDHCPISVELVF